MGDRLILRAGRILDPAPTDADTTFAMENIIFVDDPACETGDIGSNAAAFTVVDPPVGDELVPNGQAIYGVRFTSATPGRFVAAAQLFIRPDPVAQATVCVALTGGTPGTSSWSRAVGRIGRPSWNSEFELIT